VASLFHRRYGTQLFPLPRALTTPSKRVMSLRNGHVKMSKSDVSDLARINLNDSDDTIRQKIQLATSDSLFGVYIHPQRPEISNLVNLYREIWNLTQDAPFNNEEELLRYGSTLGFKNKLAEALISYLAPIRQKYEHFRSDPSYLQAILNDGQKKAFDKAHQTMQEVAPLLGISS
jgi:tryptophanyl-tRNA synthetase